MRAAKWAGVALCAMAAMVAMRAPSWAMPAPGEYLVEVFQSDGYLEDYGWVRGPNYDDGDGAYHYFLIKGKGQIRCLVRNQRHCDAWNWVRVP